MVTCHVLAHLGFVAETRYKSYIGMVARNHLGTVALLAGRQFHNCKGGEDEEAEALQSGLTVLPDRFRGQSCSGNRLSVGCSIVQLRHF